MSDLRLVLLLAGFVVLLIIAIASYQIPKVRSSFKERRARESMYQELERQPIFEEWVPPVTEQQEAIHSDIWEFLVASERRGLKKERRSLSADYITSQMLRHPDQLVVDYCVTFFSENAVTAAEVLECIRDFRLHKGRYAQIMGLVHGEDTWIDFARCRSNAAFNDIVLVHQIANVRYCIGRAETFQLQGICEQLTNQMGMIARYPFPFDQIASRAQKLYDFCTHYDLVAQINIMAANNRVFEGEKIDRVALDCGLDSMPEGYYLYSMLGEQASFKLKLVNSSSPWSFPIQNMQSFSTQGVMLVIPIPIVADPTKQLREMLELAKRISENLNGHIVDYRGRPLSEVDLRQILHDTQSISSKMSSLGIAPGSDHSIRLFVLS